MYAILSVIIYPQYVTLHQVQYIHSIPVHVGYSNKSLGALWQLDDTWPGGSALTPLTQCWILSAIFNVLPHFAAISVKTERTELQTGI